MGFLQVPGADPFSRGRIGSACGVKAEHIPEQQVVVPVHPFLLIVQQRFGFRFFCFFYFPCCLSWNIRVTGSLGGYIFPCSWEISRPRGTFRFRSAFCFCGAFHFLKILCGFDVFRFLYAAGFRQVFGFFRLFFLMRVFFLSCAAASRRFPE